MHFVAKPRSKTQMLWRFKVFTSPSWATSLNQAHKKQVVSLSHQNLIQNHKNKMSVLNMVNRWTLHQLSLLNLSFECRTLVARTRLPKLLASTNDAYIPSAEIFEQWHHWRGMALTLPPPVGLKSMRNDLKAVETGRLYPSANSTTVHLTAGDVHRYSWCHTLSPPSVTLYSKSPNLPAKTGKAEAMSS